MEKAQAMSPLLKSIFNSAHKMQTMIETPMNIIDAARYALILGFITKSS